MKKNIYLCLCLIILLIQQGCTFEPKGEDFVKLDPTGKMPNIQINLNLATDTLYIPTNTTITFAYGLNNEKINWAKFIVNGSLTNDIKVEPSMASLSRTFNEARGVTYSLEMQIFTRSQTGSMADQAGAEGYLISRKWTIIIITIADLAPRITKLGFVDGTLKIEWEKYKGMGGFTNYKIYKSMFLSNKPSFLLATINSREQTSFIDTTYAGEQSQYYVVTNDTYQGLTYGLQGPIPVITVVNPASGDMVFKWTKPPYYKNLKCYRISYYNKSNVWQTMAELTDVNSESYTIHNPLFAHAYTLYLTPVSKTDNNYSETNTRVYMSTQTRGFMGQPIPYFTDIRSGQGSVIYMINNSQLVTLFDPLKLSTIKQFRYNEGIFESEVSANDKYMVSVGNMSQKVYLEDLTDPTKSKTIDISGAVPGTIYNISVSNVGTGCIMTYNKSYLYDFINERKLAEFNLTGPSTYLNKISASGNFFYLDIYSSFVFYRYKDNQTVVLESGTEQGDNFILNCYFIPGNNEKLVRTYHNRIEVLDCNTWTLEKKWLFPNLITRVYNFDINSGKLLISENLKMVLFDVMNGTSEELASIDDNVYAPRDLFYGNGYLFWNQGFALKKN